MISARRLIPVCLVLASLAGSALPADDPFSPEDRAWWVFQPLRSPPVPQAGAAHPVDAFLDQRLTATRVVPLAEADRRTLIRRATFDLWGLPPEPREIDEFLADPRPDAFERLIDRLLASPRYGERMARYWLDLVRFAESDGYKADDLRPTAWRYRDYVIRSFNSDKPFDRFTIEQIAGDEIDPDDTEALAATAFLRHWPYEYNQRNVPLQWETILNDVTDVTSQVFMGLTVGCARCHDHKFDPILQADYYRLQAFFTPLLPADRSAAASAERRDHDHAWRLWEEATADIRAQLAEMEEHERDRVRNPEKEKFPRPMREMIDKPAAVRTPLERQLVLLAERQLEVTPQKMADSMKGTSKARYQALRNVLAKFDSLKPEPLPEVMSVTDVGPDAPPTLIPDYDEQVAPGYLTILDPRPAAIFPVSASPSTTGRRTALATWLARPDNPLLARAMMNRVWQWHFGRGLVATSNDLGRQGELPTHPELLDYLACEFIRQGFSMKAMHRLLMTSEAYRRRSVPGPGEHVAAADPDNHLWWRMPVRRLEAEPLRDAMLAASGELSGAMGGPSVLPELPEDLDSAYSWKPSPQAGERSRRSIYVIVRRNLRWPMFEAFDAPDTHESCSRRVVTTSAPQALLLVNGDWALDRARAFAGRVLREAPRSLCGRTIYAWRLAFGRPPTREERETVIRFIKDERAAFRERITQGLPVASAAGGPDPFDPAESAAWVDLCHVLLNSNEFAYVD